MSTFSDLNFWAIEPGLGEPFLHPVLNPLLQGVQGRMGHNLGNPDQHVIICGPNLGKSGQHHCQHTNCQADHLFHGKIPFLKE
jgi:hypothetical protein